MLEKMSRRELRLFEKSIGTCISIFESEPQFRARLRINKTYAIKCLEKLTLVLSQLPSEENELSIASKEEYFNISLLTSKLKKNDILLYRNSILEGIIEYLNEEEIGAFENAVGAYKGYCHTVFDQLTIELDTHYPIK